MSKIVQVSQSNNGVDWSIIALDDEGNMYQMTSHDRIWDKIDSPVDNAEDKEE